MAEQEDDLGSLREEVSRLRAEVARLTPSLALLLKTRGYRIHREKPHEPPLLPSDQYRERYYELMKSYAFRLFLRDAIKHQDGFTADTVTRYATRQVTESYIKALLAIKLLAPADGAYRLRQKPITSFGPTLEWFVAEVLKREYQTEAVWGVSFKRPKVGGDYDVIAKLAWRLLYVEVKSSPPKQIYQTEVSEFLSRVEDLAPEIAVFFMDTELRMKDKIVPLFEEELARRSIRHGVLRMHKELFHIDNRLFIMNAKESIESNFAKIIRWYFLYNTNSRQE
ncbi:MAG: hypothetical protein ACM34I_11765 [bacterium]